MDVSRFDEKTSKLKAEFYRETKPRSDLLGILFPKGETVDIWYLWKHRIDVPKLYDSLNGTETGYFVTRKEWHSEEEATRAIFNTICYIAEGT